MNTPVGSVAMSAKTWCRRSWMKKRPVAGNAA